jgi:hypothetical protein
VSTVRSLPNGELLRVPDEGEPNPARVVAPSGVAGQYQCPSCGLNCTSPAALSAHIGYDHRPSVSAVELPDGTMIPTEMMSEEIGKAEQRAKTAEATSEALVIQLAEMAEQLNEALAAKEAFEAEAKPKKKK